MSQGARPEPISTPPRSLRSILLGGVEAYHKQLPHDTGFRQPRWASFSCWSRAGKKYIVHPTRAIRVRLRRMGKVQKRWRLVKHINFVQDMKPDGTLVGRRDFGEGEHKGTVPVHRGGISWTSGSYSPKTACTNKSATRWCMDLNVRKTDRCSSRWLS